METVDQDSTGGADVGLQPPEPDESVLLLAPTMAEGAAATCGSLLQVEEPAGTDYLAVSLQDGPGERVEHWRRHVSPELPDRMGIVCAGETTRSGATLADGGSVGFPGEAIEVTSVSTPGDLTGIGMRVTDCIDAWQRDGNRTVVCLDSLTTMLQYVATERVFQFLHVLLARLDAAGAAGHVHLDPEAHDDQAVATLSSLFDVVVEEVDGEWVRR